MSQDPSNIEDELRPEQTAGYKGPGKAKTAEELEQLDYRDESLKKWEQSLGANASDGKADVKVHKIILSSATLPTPIEMDPANTVELKRNPITIKEGVEYTVSVSFTVKNAIVPGIKYIQVAKRSGVTVDKIQKMIGTFAPQDEPHKVEMLTDDSPSGMLARSGTYNTRSRIIDDDGNNWADFEWSFKIGKDW